jgi:hypothetical protein
MSLGSYRVLEISHSENPPYWSGFIQ